MRRDLSRLASTAHDLLVIGGGIQGACIAWDATQRGLAVALVERDDFGAATSANSLRIVHGGIRYLARGDLTRMRESIRERSALLRIAPGLVEPLPVLVPTGPPGVPGRAAFGAALALTHALSLTRNRHLDPSRHIAAGRILSRAETLRHFPALDPGTTTGAALWYDARMSHPERLTLAFVASAAAAGAQVANHAEAVDFDLAGDSATRMGVRAVGVRDRLTGERYDIRARQVVIAAGPWTESLSVQAGTPPRLATGIPRHAYAMNLVLGRRVADVAVGLRSSGSADDDPGGSGGRFLFLAPQASTTLLGTWYGVADESDDVEAVLDCGTERFLAEFNRTCPGLALTTADIVGRQWGRLPLKAGLERGPAETLAERPRLGDQGGEARGNLLTVEAVKYTTARAVAEQVVDRVVSALGLPPRPCRTTVTPLVGAGLQPRPPALAERLRHAADGEMAVTLRDMLRRTELGDQVVPDPGAVRLASRIASEALGWDGARRADEEASVLRVGAA